jgi:hypothetical protein
MPDRVPRSQSAEPPKLGSKAIGNGAKSGAKRNAKRDDGGGHDDKESNLSQQDEEYEDDNDGEEEKKFSEEILSPVEEAEGMKQHLSNWKPLDLLYPEPSGNYYARTEIEDYTKGMDQYVNDGREGPLKSASRGVDTFIPQEVFVDVQSWLESKGSSFL